MTGRQMAFPTDEFRQRLARVQAAVRERGWAGLFVHTPENIYYLSGYQTSGYFAYQVLLVPPEGDPLLLVRQLEQSNADEYSWLGPEQQAVYLDIEDPIEVTHRLLLQQGWTEEPIGIEKNGWFFTVQQFEHLVALAPSITFADASGIVDHVRLIKSPREIAFIRRAANVVGIGMQAALDTLAVGRTENDVAAAIHEAEIRHGCEYTGLPHIVGSGYRSRLGHVNWSDKRIEEGDIIHLELSGCVMRYSAALWRTAIMGQPPADLLTAIGILTSSQDRAIALMKPGVPAGEIDAAVRQPVLAAGLRETYYNRVGYSIGIGFPPRWGEWATRDFMQGDTWRLEPGMVFHMIIGARGVGLSETVLVTDTGHEILTHFDRRLFSL